MSGENEDVKPCPFCGCKSSKTVWLYHFGCTVECKRCKSQTALKRRESEAIARWNKRTVEVNGTFINDENHRIGPNGELLTAVTAYIDPEYSFESCKKCLYVNIPKLKCSRPVSERLCSPTSRKDKARIHWEVAGDRT